MSKGRKTTTKRKARAKTNGSAKWAAQFLPWISTSDSPSRRSRQAKKWNSDDSDEAEDPSHSEHSDIEVDTAAELTASGSEEDTGTSPREKKLGRAARTRAKV